MIDRKVPKQTKLWRAEALTSAMLLLLSHSEALAKEVKNSPAKVEPIAGSDVSLVTLVEPASQRLGIETAMVRDLQLAPHGTAVAAAELRKVIPYSAVIYDTTGNAWVYTVTAGSFVYLRQPISIDYSEGN